MRLLFGCTSRCPNKDNNTVILPGIVIHMVLIPLVILYLMILLAVLIEFRCYRQSCIVGIGYNQHFDHVMIIIVLSIYHDMQTSSIVQLYSTASMHLP